MLAERAKKIREEMAVAIREIGGQDAMAKIANERAARATGLTTTTVERLRWRKVARIPADIVDTVREALARHVEKQKALARAEAEFVAALRRGDPDVDRDALAEALPPRRARRAVRRAVALEPGAEISIGRSRRSAGSKE